MLTSEILTTSQALDKTSKDKPAQNDEDEKNKSKTNKLQLLFREKLKQSLTARLNATKAQLEQVLNTDKTQPNDEAERKSIIDILQ